MSQELKHKIYASTDCIPEKTMFNYIDKRLSPAEEHQIEKHLIDCEFCSDAIEGLRTLKDRKRLEYINNEIDKKTNKEGRVISINLKVVFAIAASILLLLGSIFVFKLSSPLLKEQNVAQLDNAKPENNLEYESVSKEKTNSNSNSQTELTTTDVTDTEKDANKQAELTGGHNETAKSEFKNTVSTKTEALQDNNEGTSVTTSSTIAADETKALDRKEGLLSKDQEVYKNTDLISSNASGNTVTTEISQGATSPSYAWSSPSVVEKNDKKTVNDTENRKNTSGKFNIAKKEKESKNAPSQQKAVEQQVENSANTGEAASDIDISNNKSAPLEETTLQSAVDSTEFITEEMPEFPGGEKELFKFIAKNFKYPNTANNQEITKTKIYVEFTIDKNGYVKNARIKKGINADLDKEALRVINSMPKWSPAKSNGKPVDIKINYPIQLEFK